MKPASSRARTSRSNIAGPTAMPIDWRRWPPTCLHSCHRGEAADLRTLDPDGGDADKDDEGGQNVKGVRKFQSKSDDTHVVVLTAGGSSSFSDSLLCFKTRSARGSLNVHQEIDFDKLVQIAYTVRYSA